MGKNRKAKQVVNQAETQSNGDGHRDEVPVDFLTSDDFQVVPKRHHSKKSDECCIPRSRSNSERLVNENDLFGCHAGFWTARAQSTEDTAAPSSDNSLLNKKAGHDELSAGDLALRNGNVALNDVSQSDGESGKLNCSLTDPVNPGDTAVQSNADSLKTCDVPLSGEEGPCLRDIGKIPLADEAILSQDREIEDVHSESSQLDKKETVVTSLVGDTSDENEIVKPTGVDAKGDEKRMEETSRTKKKDKKSKSKKSNEKTKSGTTSESKTSEEMVNPKVLVYSSSSDFSEVAPTEKNEDCGKRDRKRPSKKQLEAIHESLRKAKEEEEKLKQEEEAKRKLAEEAERQAQEQLRLEQEKKEKKKLKEKLKKDRLRAEGKLLSKSQKQARARMQATLEVLRQQGIDVPLIGEKRLRRPRLDSYKSTHRKRLDSTQSDTTSQAERHKSESLSSQESSGKDSLSDLPSSFDSKDSWDINAIVGSLLSDGMHMSCSEESDDERSSSAAASKEAIASKLKESLSKSNLAKLPTKVEEIKDSVKLRSPVVCVLGHVDTGKTKLLDYIRKTHVQDSEAGGITQQIGATMIPQEALKEKCKMVKDFSSFEMEVPGLLVIDTPGHESFSNLRSRGSSICDIAILVVDIMHGLEPQTLESINLLKMGKIPFVVALNKIDRLYGWKSAKDEDVESTLNSQSQNTSMEFKKRCQEVVLQFANECLNAALYYENPDPRTYVSMVPTSAITGDGMGNLLSLITQLTQSLMHKTLVFTQELQATVLEVKAIAGLGTTIDVILVNGRLQEGDTIVLAGQEGPIVTQIRSLLMPQPLKELRVKNPYIEYKAVEGAQGVKVTGKDLDKTLAGLPLFVSQNQSRLEALKSEVSALLEQTVSCIKTSERGVYVQSSTLGSLEALLDYLTSMGVPYFGVKVGPVVKKDVTKASIMLEHDAQYATILAFDVKVERDAQDLADSLGVKIISANIIYHLYDGFLKHRVVVLKKREEAMHLAVFPCILRLVSHSPSDPTVFRVNVEAGTLKLGTPLCVPTRGNLELGVVEAMKVDGEPATRAKEGQDVHIFVEGQSKVTQLDPEDYFISRVTKQSIDVCKEYYRDELDPSDWNLMGELRKMLHTHV